MFKRDLEEVGKKSLLNLEKRTLGVLFTVRIATYSAFTEFKG